MFSYQRQITQRTLLTVSYVGNQAHRIPTVVSVNLGNPALCLSLRGAVPSEKTTTTPLPAARQSTEPVPGKIADQSPQAKNGENSSDSTIANSNYNALETTLRYQRRQPVSAQLRVCKVHRSGSNIGEQLDPFNPRQTAQSPHGTRSTPLCELYPHAAVEAFLRAPTG